MSIVSAENQTLEDPNKNTVTVTGFKLRVNDSTGTRDDLGSIVGVGTYDPKSKTVVLESIKMTVSDSITII